MAVYMGLSAAKAKLWEGSDPNSFAGVESEVEEEPVENEEEIIETQEVPPVVSLHTPLPSLPVLKISPDKDIPRVPQAVFVTLPTNL